MAVRSISAIYTHIHIYDYFLGTYKEMEIECGSCKENVAHLFGLMLPVVHTRVVKYYEIILAKQVK